MALHPEVPRLTRSTPPDPLGHLMYLIQPSIVCYIPTLLSVSTAACGRADDEAIDRVAGVTGYH